MTFKCLLQIVVEKITGKMCEQCKYNNGFLCNNPDPFVNENAEIAYCLAGLRRKNKKSQ